MSLRRRQAPSQLRARHPLLLDSPNCLSNSRSLARAPGRRRGDRRGRVFQYAVSRLVWLVPAILAMALVTFLVMHATPGSPLDPVAEGANPLSPEAQKALAKHYGLDKPLYEQLGIFLVKAVQGDF